MHTLTSVVNGKEAFSGGSGGGCMMWDGLIDKGMWARVRKRDFLWSESC